ncbi:MAG TPA: histidine phosphatase family protein [Plasticicumulans sp.]|nr:histidine phosphatase family protein [Plasticicumulans sp.]
MQLLLIRHGIAEDTAPSGGGDAERALAAVGARRLRKGANRLRMQFERLDHVLCSPYRRTRESAAILCAAWGLAAPQTIAGCTPHDAPEDVLPVLAGLDPDAHVALVGHEPHLGCLAGLLLSGSAEPLLRLRKGGAALIVFPGAPAAGTGRLHWALTAGQMRALRD